MMLSLSSVMPEPMAIEIPFMARGSNVVYLYQVHSNVESSRVDILFEWPGCKNCDGGNWTSTLSAAGESGLECLYSRGGTVGRPYRFDVVPRGLRRLTGGRSVYAGYCSIPAVVKARFYRKLCVNVTIVRKKTGDFSTMAACPLRNRVNTTLAMCVVNPLRGLLYFTTRLLQWLEYYIYVMASDVHFFIYLSRKEHSGIGTLGYGIALLRPYIDSGFVTVVWQSSFYTLRHLERHNSAQVVNANDCLYRAKQFAFWMYNSADVDEYVAPHRFLDWGVTLPVDSDVFNLRAILGRGVEAGVVTFELEKCPSLPVSDTDVGFMQPVRVCNYTPWELSQMAMGKHISRPSYVSLYGIHTEVSAEDGVDWGIDRVNQRLSLTPEQYRFGEVLSVEYVMLHFSRREWRRCCEDAAKSGKYVVMDAVWRYIERRIEGRFVSD